MANIEQEMLHVTLQNFYLNKGTEVVNDSEEWHLFQSSQDPTTLGYEFIETMTDRRLRLPELDQELQQQNQ